MESQDPERGAARPADPAPARASQTCAPTQTAGSSSKPSVREPTRDVKLTSDGQIVEAGYGHGV